MLGVMDIKSIKDKALRAALPLLATSGVGRLFIDKGIEMVAKKLDLPIKGDYMKETERWLITVGEQGAAAQAVLNISNDALAAILEEIGPDIVSGREVSREKVLALLQKYLCAAN